MKAVIYARYSSDNQREESIEGQLRECKEYAERNGILVLQSYIDRALSAKTDNRPEFQRMIRDSAKGLFDTVLVWKLDRFARNRYDSAHYKSLLRKNGVKVVSATESIADGPEGIILESMLEGMAEYYSAELAQKVNRGMRENALKARSNGGTIPLGYRLDEEHRLKIDPLTAPVVREVFQRYADGENLRTIIRSLNERGIRTSRNYPFRHSSFNTMLKNRKYIGEYHYKDVIIPDAVPPIISKELFERVQERMKKNQHAPARAKAEEEYLLTTKLFCGHCGRLMIGESGKGRNGTIHRYYKCAGAKRRLGCHKKAVKKDWIERVAVQYTIQRVFQDDLIAQIADELVALQGAEDSALPLLRRQLTDTERGIENMLNAIQQGIFTSSTRQRLEELENLRAELKSSILQAELERPQYSREDIIQWISRFKGGDPNDKAYQRQIIDIFLNSIYVFDDKLVFTYNYKNGSQTVSLADVFAAFGSDSRAGASPESRQTILRLPAFPLFRGREKKRYGPCAGGRLRICAWKIWSSAGLQNRSFKRQNGSSGRAVLPVNQTVCRAGLPPEEHAPARPAQKCLPKAGGCVMLETKKEERERYGRNAHSLKTSHKHVFSQWGLAPLFVLESGGYCRAFPFLGTAWNYAATCISGPFCAQTRPSGTFCKGREVLLCRKFCCLQTI